MTANKAMRRVAKPCRGPTPTTFFASRLAFLIQSASQENSVNRPSDPQERRWGPEEDVRHRLMSSYSNTEKVSKLKAGLLTVINKSARDREHKHYEERAEWCKKRESPCLRLEDMSC
jgi:hypothetical protein